MKASDYPFHVMAKPGGATCNLACRYCYYLDKSALHPSTRFPRMSDAMLERYVANLIASHPEGAEVIFSWQGGEPALLGLDFYRRAVELQRRHAGSRRVENTFQTNGTLLDDDWCRFLVRERFLVGLSLDGPAEIHDIYRRYAGGRASHTAVMRGLHRLQAHGVEFNLLACVHRQSSQHPLAVYDFLRSTGARFIQFIPVVERSPEHDEVTEWSVQADAYGEFMCAVFDHWYERDAGDVVVMNFEWALASFIGLPGAVCHHQPVCGRALAVEHDGRVYACDHFVAPQYRLGNINDDALSALVDAPRQQAFGRSKFDALPASCLRCPVVRACWGGCPKHRFVTDAAAEKPLNFLCAGYKRFFTHVAPALGGLAERVSRNRIA
ncbi:MAG: anaerobic sulfatase maturase [Propionivibrio sp.]